MLPAAAQEAAPPRPAVMAPLAVQGLLLDGARAGDRLVVVGERGHILVSDDAGGRWRQVASPVQSTLTAVTFPDPQHGWAVGHDAAILHSADGGEHWALQHWAPQRQQPLLDVWFRNAREGFAVGAYGLYLTTRDGGRSWVAASVRRGEELHLNGIAALDDRTLFIAAEAGAVYRSRDGGARWQRLTTPYAGSYFGALALPGRRLLIFGLRGKVFESRDLGETWRALDSATTASLMGGGAGDGGIALVGLGGTLLTQAAPQAPLRLTTLPARTALAAPLFVNGRYLLLGERGVTAPPPGTRP